MMTVEQGVKEIMAILEEGNDNVKKYEGSVGAGGALSKPAKTIKPAIKPAINPTIKPVAATSQTKETIYDGRGHALSINGRSVAKGYKKGAKRVGGKDPMKADLVLSTQVLLERTSAFSGKTGMNSTEGLVVRLADADYTVKVVGHAKREFADREENFTPEKSYITRGKAVNHAPAIAKIIVSEFENQNPCASFPAFQNQKSITLLSASATAIRIEICNSKGEIQEMSFKITKKRTRLVLD